MCRCVATAEGMFPDKLSEVRPSRLVALGPFSSRSEEAKEIWRRKKVEMGWKELIQTWLGGSLDGVPTAREQASQTLTLLSEEHILGKLDICITHDVCVLAMAEFIGYRERTETEVPFCGGIFVPYSRLRSHACKRKM